MYFLCSQKIKVYNNNIELIGKEKVLDSFNDLETLREYLKTKKDIQVSSGTYTAYYIRDSIGNTKAIS